MGSVSEPALRPYTKAILDNDMNKNFVETKLKTGMFI